jgi:glycine hydroxymethyltransferase
MKNLVANYLKGREIEKVDIGFIAYLANLCKVAEVAPTVAQSIIQELADQRSNLKLIASENYSSLGTQLAMGNLLTDKYAEGYPFHRFYAGCDNVDAIENFACEQARAVFGCEHAYAQPHSGADANLIAFWAILHQRVKIPLQDALGEANPSNLDRNQWQEIRRSLGNQRLLGMDYYSGGHLTHGYRQNVSAQMFDVYSYGVNNESGLIDYAELEKMALNIKPLILLAGYSAYPRAINFRRLREIANKVNAVFMVDMAHFAGLVAGKVFTEDYNPVAFAQVVTTTTHKTLRGPRGGMVLCNSEFADAVDKGCPLVIGGPLPHVLAAKAICLVEAGRPEFATYASKIVENAKSMAEACKQEGMTLTTGGTDNHLFLIDVRPFGLTGRQAESALRECRITLNRNSLPNDPNGPWYTSGLRLGTPAVTTLGMGSTEVTEIAKIVSMVLKNTSSQGSKAKYATNEGIKKEARERVTALLAKFPVYPELDLDFLQEAFGVSRG